jgi:hypothetical protein
MGLPERMGDVSPLAMHRTSGRMFSYETSGTSSEQGHVPVLRQGGVPCCVSLNERVSEWRDVEE